MWNPDKWIEKLSLQPHPEGGYFSETYRSVEHIAASSLPDRYNGARAISTAIYFLLKGNEFSAFHKLNSDEIWHFHYGCAIEIFIIRPDAALYSEKLGTNIFANEKPQVVIPAGTWFAAQPINYKSFTLVSCTVAPGFDFSDFQLGDREKLIKSFPDHKNLIIKYTKEN